MTALHDRSPLGLWRTPELVNRVIDYVDAPIDLFHCSCVSRVWYSAALWKLYRGSMNDMRYRTPDISSLNALLVSSRESFTRSMQLVKFLTIVSEETSKGSPFRARRKPTCLALSDRKSAELLLRPRGKGPASLAIPFELIDHDLSNMSDLILHPDLKFLTIDAKYCKLLNLDSGSAQGHATPFRLSSLEGLSIYVSKKEIDIDKICEWLLFSDLKIFQIDDYLVQHRISDSDMKQFMRCLRGHRNLQALALRLSVRVIEESAYETEWFADETEGSADKTEGPANENEESADVRARWPRLKAVYVRVATQSWYERLAAYENLEVLEVRKADFPTPIEPQRLAQGIALCRNLQVITVEALAMNPELFIFMASGCPLLRKFCVKDPRGDSNGWKMTGEQFLRLLGVLPRIEFLSLGFIFEMAASNFRDLANSCPQLTILKLKGTRLLLSLESLVEAPTLSHLREMKLGSVSFPQLDSHRDLLAILRECNRVFPELRRSHVPTDLFNPEDMSANTPIEKHWSTTREWLWGLMGFETQKALALRNLWQSSLETQTLGWPVLPAKAFLEPQTYSTGNDKPKSLNGYYELTIGSSSQSGGTLWPR